MFKINHRGKHNAIIYEGVFIKDCYFNNQWPCTPPLRIKGFTDSKQKGGIPALKEAPVVGTAGPPVGVQWERLLWKAVAIMCARVCPSHRSCLAVCDTWCWSKAIASFALRRCIDVKIHSAPKERHNRRENKRCIYLQGNATGQSAPFTILGYKNK